MTNLFEASNQWSTRPADERFWSLDEMYERCRAYRETSLEAANVRIADLTVENNGGELILGGANHSARFSNWAFGQMCQRIGAPANYLRECPADLVTPLINHGLRTIGADGANTANILFHRTGSLLARAFTSKKYSRIWNHELIARLQGLQAQGWTVPPAWAMGGESAPGARRATAEDVTRSSIVQIGDWIQPSGLYASDHDMFAFLVNDDIRIDDGTDGGLARGVFVSNSEVGAASLKVTRFLYRYVCGNHIVWDCKDVKEIRIRHTGSAHASYGRKLAIELREYASLSTDRERERIALTKRAIIGDSKDAVLDRLFGLKLLPRKPLEKAFEQAVIEADHARDFSPRSTWGMVQGITALSQNEQFGENRVALDRAAGKLLQINF